jgi:hypothetical protein
VSLLSLGGHFHGYGLFVTIHTGARRRRSRRATSRSRFALLGRTTLHSSLSQVLLS